MGLSQPPASSHETNGGPPPSWQIAAEIILGLTFFSLLSIYAARPIGGIDVFWQVVTGRIIWETGAIPTQDILSSIEPDRPWRTLQWAYAVGVYKLDRWGGLSLVRAAHSGVQYLAFVVFWWGCRRRLRFGPFASIALVTLYVILYADRFRCRAHVFNLLSWCVLFPWMYRGAARLDRAAYVAVAAVVFVWANLHAGGAFIFMIAAGCLPAAAVIAQWAGAKEGDPAATRRAFFWFGCATVPALIAPNFVPSIVELTTILGGNDVFIPEWGPTWGYLFKAKVVGHYICGALATALAVIWALLAARPLGAVAREGKAGLSRVLDAQVHLPTFLLALAMLVVAHRAIRFVQFGALAAVFIWPTLARQWPRTRSIPAAAQAAVAALLIIVSYDSRINLLYSGSFERAVRTAFGEKPILANRFPEAQADFLKKTDFKGGIFCQPKWGGYLLYRLWPNATVSSDGRVTFSEEAMYAHWTASTRANFMDPANGPEIQAIYEKWSVDAVVGWHPVFPINYQPPAERWRPVFADDIGEVWIRSTERGLRYLNQLPK